MLNNLVNRYDVGRAYRKATDGDLRSVLDKVRGNSEERVVRQWSDTEREPTQWWSIPAVRRRWNELVSGDEKVDFPEYAARRYLQDRPGLTALSLGCGMGGRELRWAELGVFEHIDAFDIAPASVEVAAAAAREAGFSDEIRFAVRDFTKLGDGDRYDVVLAEHSLHHLAPMPEVVAKVDGLLNPGGLFLVDEFVGPKRFQWTDAQLAEAQLTLERFPEELRVQGSAGVKRRVIRPSRLWMVMTDPSEAIDSARITASLHHQFDVLEELPYGGAVLHLALADIAQNFVDGDPLADQVLTAAFEYEDRLMSQGRVASDFVAFVCRKRDDAQR